MKAAAEPAPTSPLRERDDAVDIHEAPPSKIVYVNPAANLGGGELSLLDLISSTRIAAPGSSLHLVVSAPGPLAERAASLGVQVHVLDLPKTLASIGDSMLRGRGKLASALALALMIPTAGLASLRHARRLRSLLRAVGPTLVHSNGIKAHLLLALAPIPGMPVIWHIRDLLGNRPVVAGLLRHAARRGAAGAIAVSEAVAQDARSVLGPRFLIETIHDGIDVDRFAPGPGDGDELDALASLPHAEEGTIRVGLVATYARWKGHKTFLDALGLLASTAGPPVRGYIVGGPIYETRGSQFSEAELKARADALGLGDRIGFVPFRPDPADVYRALDIAVHASTLPEPFGRTIVEAMACGRATIVSQAGGAAELFNDNLDAIGVQPGDQAALADAITRLAANPDARRAIGARARATAVERFDRRKLGPEVLAAYRRLGIGDRMAT